MPDASAHYQRHHPSAVVRPRYRARPTEPRLGPSMASWHDQGGSMMNAPVEDAPLALQVVDAAQIIEADVREDLRAGREPFACIMTARGEVPVHGALMVRAIFEPAP